MKHINIKENDFSKIIICSLAIVLLFILISHSYFNAKYKSNINGLNSTRIAKWNVGTDVASNPNNSLSIISENNTPSYILEVNSTSEVASSYYIVLSNVPPGLEVKLDNKQNYQRPINNTIIISDVGSFTASDSITTKRHTLTFNDPLTTSNTGNNEIKIDVIFEQVD